MKFTPSIITLLAANSIPLYGVLFLGWDLDLIVFMYWFENLVIGFYTILRIYKSQGEITHGVNVSTFSGTKEYKSRTAIILFFIVHFGLFTAVHGAIVFSLFIKSLTISMTLLIAILTLFASHGFSYLTNYIGNKEYETARPGRLMLSPYKRVLIMHMTVIFGGMVTSQSNSDNVLPLFVLVGIKTIADIFSHIIEHSKILTDPKNQTIHLPDSISKRILSIPGFEENARKAFEESVNTGKWDEIKKDLDPDTVKYIEDYYKKK